MLSLILMTSYTRHTAAVHVILVRITHIKQSLDCWTRRPLAPAWGSSPADTPPALRGCPQSLDVDTRMVSALTACFRTIWLSWVSCSRFSIPRKVYKIDPNQRTIICCGKKCHILTQVFLGGVWPWVGEFVGFIITFTFFSIPNIIWEKLAKHP